MLRQLDSLKLRHCMHPKHEWATLKINKIQKCAESVSSSIDSLLSDIYLLDSVEHYTKELNATNAVNCNIL